MDVTVLIRGLLALLPFVVAMPAYVQTTGPAQAQFFFDDRYPFLDRRRGPYYDPREYQQRERPQPPADYSRAPAAAARKPDQAPSKTIVVLGDSMADWLAYGLEEAFHETPEVGVLRKHRTGSGLIRAETRTESHDWVQAARDILNADRADFIVMMIGLGDRQQIRERPEPRRPPAQPGTPQAGQGQQARPGAQAQQQGAAQPQQQGQDEASAQPRGEESSDSPSSVGPEATRTGATVTHEFRSERWTELYGKRIDDLIAVLKAKGVPVYWVGLPAVRGTRSTADVVFLNELFRTRAERAGITYIDVWDGFVDDGGSFSVQGPDVEGQTRRLRTADGVHFTKAGARKLAHYVEREIQRALVAQPVLVSLPTQAPEEPQPPLAPGGRLVPGRPPAGPIVYLTGAPKGGEELLGGNTRMPAADQTATRVLVRGEAITAPAGRADDFAWPRREITNASVSNIAEPELPPPPGSEAAARAAQAAAAAKQAPPRPVQPRVAQQPRQQQHYAPQSRWPSFWPFGGRW